ncbi:MAG: carbon-nitrogen hydrolase family protein [Deltaproteobacteria bacterium]|nr:carbon-nitrogen hydrolase family protein [Deltaproteobacteria bacterium]
MADLTLAAVQLASLSTHRDLEARKSENLARVEGYIDAIAGLNPTVELVAFPELCIPGADPVNFAALAESIPGPLTERICDKARRAGVWLVPGTLLELGRNGKIYNTAILVSPDGEIEMKYRKVCVPYPLEPSSPGEGFPVFEIPGKGKIGMMICSDGHWPEVARSLALNGAELILKPTLQPHWIGGARNHDDIAVTRAVENQLYLVSVNQPTPVGMGRTLAVDPEGRTIETLGESEAFTVLRISFDEVRRVREHGSFGMFCFLKMLREFSEAGLPLEEIYRQGVANAPVFSTLHSPSPRTPDQIRRPDNAAASVAGNPVPEGIPM